MRCRGRGAPPEGTAGSRGGAPARDAVKGRRRGGGYECLCGHRGVRAVPVRHPGHLRLQPAGGPARVSARGSAPCGWSPNFPAGAGAAPAGLSVGPGRGGEGARLGLPQAGILDTGRNSGAKCQAPAPGRVSGVTEVNKAMPLPLRGAQGQGWGRSRYPQPWCGHVLWGWALVVSHFTGTSPCMAHTYLSLLINFRNRCE